MMSTAFLLLLFVNAIGGAQAAASVEIGFQAQYDSVYPDGLDDFVSQLKVMIARTDAGLTANDILGVTVSGSTAGTIVCDVAVQTDALAAALTQTVVARHLSVYINRVGYIATLGSQAPAPTVTVAPRPDTLFTVTVVFEADYDAHDLEAFSAAINSSLVVTNTIEANDLARVVFTQGEGAIYATIALRSAVAVAAVTRAAVASRFRVAVGAATYTAKLASLPGNSTTVAPETTTAPPPVTTDTPASTESTAHPTEDGFVWLNEYTSDNENIMDCSAGHDWSGIVISKMPVGCHRFQHTATKQDEFNFLGLDADSGTVSRFGMICDTQCSSCISQQESGMAFNSCQETWGGSVAVYPKDGHCLGASYIEVEDGALSLFRYSGAACDLTTNPSDTLYVRNYPAPATGKAAACTADGTTGKYYALTRTADNEGEVFFSGKMDCTDSECSEGCTKVDSWQEGSCNADAAGNGMQIWESTNVLKECGSETGIQAQPAAGEQPQAMVSVAEVAGYAQPAEKVDATVDVETTVAADLEPVNTTVDIETTVAAANGNETAANGNKSAALPDETQQWASVPVKQLRMGASVHQTATAPEETQQSYNKQMYSLMVAGAGVLAVAFAVIGVLYRRKHAVRNAPPGEEDIMRDFRAYAESNGYSDYHDERLITDI